MISAAVLERPAGHGLDVGLVGLAEVGGVGAGDGTLLAHPGDRHGGVETPEKAMPTRSPTGGS
jgi:hypothetical protein